MSAGPPKLTKMLHGCMLPCCMNADFFATQMRAAYRTDTCFVPRVNSAQIRVSLQYGCRPQAVRMRSFSGRLDLRD